MYIGKLLLKDKFEVYIDLKEVQLLNLIYRVNIGKYTSSGPQNYSKNFQIKQKRPIMCSHHLSGANRKIPCLIRPEVCLLLQLGNWERLLQWLLLPSPEYNNIHLRASVSFNGTGSSLHLICYDNCFNITENRHLSVLNYICSKKLFRDTQSWMQRECVGGRFHICVGYFCTFFVEIVL